MLKRKFVKFVLIIPALAGLFLLASVPNFSTKALDKSVWIMTEDEITVDRTFHDFGTIKENGGYVITLFTITNNSKDPVMITYVGTSCGCTSPDWTKEPIDPGKTGEVRVAYNPRGRSGIFDKQVTIMTNGNPARIIVRIKGKVVE